MRRALFIIFLLFFCVFCFAQQNTGFTVIGRVPDAGDPGIYQIQVGAFQHFHHAEGVYGRLYYASLNPAYEKYESLTRVLINGVAAKDVPVFLYRIQQLGFNEVIIRVDNSRSVRPPPVPAVTVRPPAVVMKPQSVEIFINPMDTSVKKETPAPVIEEKPAPPPPVQEAPRVVEAAPRPQQPLPRLPAPGNRYPEDGHILTEDHLRQQRSITFNWDEVEGATGYIFSIFQDTPQGNPIFTINLEQTTYTLEDLEIFENDGTYVWQVEAFNNRQRGQPGENGLSFDIPYAGRVNVKDPGFLYGNE